MHPFHTFVTELLGMGVLVGVPDFGERTERTRSGDQPPQAWQRLLERCHPSTVQ